MSDRQEKLARRFHDTYERLAPQFGYFGYETRGDTKDFDPDSPSGKLMTAVCSEVVNSEVLYVLEKLKKKKIIMSHVYNNGTPVVLNQKEVVPLSAIESIKKEYK